MESSFLSSNGGPLFFDFSVAIAFAFFFVAARFFFDKFVFRRLAIWLLHKGAAPLKFNEATQAKIIKCSESLWKLTYYATVEACILQITYHEPWLRDTKEYFAGWPNQELNWENYMWPGEEDEPHAFFWISSMPTGGAAWAAVADAFLWLPLKLYYMCECGFYIYSIAALLTWETRRKDFAVMMSHHVITVTLISYSYATSFFRIGSIVLALHDASDVFMEAAKVCKYSEKELGASVFFGFFAVSWLILRLIFFPFWVIRASSFDLCNYLELSDPYQRSMYYIFNTMLIMLLVFHVYWWILICAMIMRQLKNKGKVGEDIRSDSDDD